MAVDSRNKRFSLASLMGHEIMPNPDGGFGSKADRQQVGGYYSGIDADAPVSGFVPFPRPRGLSGGLGMLYGGMHK